MPLTSRTGYGTTSLATCRPPRSPTACSRCARRHISFVLIADLSTDLERHGSIYPRWSIVEYVLSSCRKGDTDEEITEEERLPGSLKLRRRAPGLYRRLFKGTSPLDHPHVVLIRHFIGFYPSLSAPALPPPEVRQIGGSVSLTMADGFTGPPPSDPYSSGRYGSSGSLSSRAPLVVGDFEHDLPVSPMKHTVFPGIDFLSCYVSPCLSVRDAITDTYIDRPLR